MLFLTITTSLIVLGSVVTVIMIRAAGPAEPISVQRAKPTDLLREIQELHAQLRTSEAQLTRRIKASEGEIQQLRTLYVNHREDVARALTATDRASVRRDSELRRDIQPARRLELVSFASQTAAPTPLQTLAELQPGQPPLEGGAPHQIGTGDSAVG
jgi:hypothetical protein